MENELVTPRWDVTFEELSRLCWVTFEELDNSLNYLLFAYCTGVYLENKLVDTLTWGFQNEELVLQQRA